MTEEYTQPNPSNASIRKNRPTTAEPIGEDGEFGLFLAFCRAIPLFQNGDDLLSAVAALIRKVLKVKGAAVIVVDRKTNELFIPAACVSDALVEKRLKSIRFSSDKALPGYFFQSTRPHVVNDFADSPQGFQAMDPLAGDYVRNRLLAPLRINEGYAGTLWAINKEGDRFNALDADLLGTIAGVTAVAMEKIQTRDELAHSHQNAADFKQAKDRVTHHLSHALKTPLAVLIACLKLLEKYLRLSTDTGWQKILVRARHNLDRLLSIEYEMEDILRQPDDPSCAVALPLHEEDRHNLRPGQKEPLHAPLVRASTATQSGLAAIKAKSLTDTKTGIENPESACADTCPGEHLPSAACQTDQSRTIGKQDDEDFFRQVNIEFLVHELKAPVSIVETGAHLLLDKQGPDAPLTSNQQRTLQRVLRNAAKTRAMLSELLEIGRAQNACFHCRPFQPLDQLRQILLEVIEAGAPELFDLMKNCRNISSKLALLAQHGIRLDASVKAETMTLQHDEIKFSQIVGNLLKNGLYYRRRHLLVHAAMQHDTFSIAVRDDGPGIAPAHHEIIFQRYKQIVPCEGVARNGHGLGLAVARILARTMGGDIVVESELGQGALFKVTVPLTLPSTPQGR